LPSIGGSVTSEHGFIYKERYADLELWVYQRGRFWAWKFFRYDDFGRHLIRSSGNHYQIYPELAIKDGRDELFTYFRDTNHWDDDWMAAKVKQRWEEDWNEKINR
jgi:hypothetical protein